MNRVVVMLSTAVRSAPLLVLLVAVGLTAVIGSFASQVEQGGGNEGFSPDNPELLAQQRVAEVFGGDGDVVLQVLLRAEPGTDLIGAAGVRATLDLRQALIQRHGDVLVDRPDQPPVASPLGPVLQAATQQGLDPAALDDATVDELFTQTLQAMPAEQAGFVTGLLPDGTDPAAATTDLALAVVFLDAEALPDDDEAAAEIVQDVAATIEGLDVPDVGLEPFAFQLLFASTDSFTQEIARLFSLAIIIIIVLLSLVYIAAPRADGTWLGSLRRTAADVGLTLAVVLMAIAWVQGAAGLLGPNVLGLLDPLAEPAQILPVLLIGLGVDYGIHLTARYREEVAGAEVPAAIGTATRTVGIALVLATVTTAVGFLTNITAPVPALRDFGILAAIGIVAAFLLMLTVFPAARLLLDRRAERAGRLPRQTLAAGGQSVLNRGMEGLSVLARRAAVPTLLVTVVVGGTLGGIGLANVSTEFSFTDFLPEDDPLIVTYDTITESFGAGFGETTTVVVQGPITPEVEAAVDDVVADLGTVEGVVTFGGVPAVEPPETVRDAPGGGDVMRVVVQTDVGESGAGELADRLNAAFEPVAATLGDDGTVVTTSDGIISDRITASLRDSQLRSLFIAVLAAMVLLVVTYWVSDRRPLLGVVTIAPVALVVLWTFGMMAATGIPVGPVTATIAALAVGIGVPYTIHVTNRWSEDRRVQPTAEAAIRATVGHTGGALAGSAVTTIAGFGVLVTSSLTPFQQFGLVTAYSIGFSLLAATIVLPSMLVLYDRWLRRHGDDPTVMETPVDADPSTRRRRPPAAPARSASSR